MVFIPYFKISKREIHPNSGIRHKIVDIISESLYNITHVSPHLYNSVDTQHLLNPGIF